jgi:hypothetical protein
MTGEPKTCGNCAMRSDAVNNRNPDFCYEFDKTVMQEAPGCTEWRGSLRAEPLNDPPVREGLGQ